MPIEQRYINLAELQVLLSTPLSGSVFSGETIDTVSCADIYCEVEYIKKDHRNNLSILNLINNKNCEFYGAVNANSLQVSCLNTDSLCDGLFETRDDFYTVQLWQSGIEPSIGPACSIHRISLRYYDSIWQTEFHITQEIPYRGPI